MTTRLHRVWTPGSPQRRVFLPNFWMVLCPPDGTERLRPNVVKFRVPLQMTGPDVRNYLGGIYGEPVRSVRLQVQQGHTYWLHADDEWAKSALEKDEDEKYAYVTLARHRHFVYPDLFPKEVIRGTLEKQLERMDEMVDELGSVHDPRLKEKRRKLLEKDAALAGADVDRYRPHGTHSWFGY